MDLGIAVFVILLLSAVLSPLFKSWRHWRKESGDLEPPVECEFVYVPCAGGCEKNVLAVAGRKVPECAKCWDSRYSKDGAA